MIRKTMADATRMLFRAALAHVKAIDARVDLYPTQEQLDEACLYYAEMFRKKARKSR